MKDNLFAIINKHVSKLFLIQMMQLMENDRKRSIKIFQILTLPYFLDIPHGHVQVDFTLPLSPEMWDLNFEVEAHVT